MTTTRKRIWTTLPSSNPNDSIQAAYLNNDSSNYLITKKGKTEDSMDIISKSVVGFIGGVGDRTGYGSDFQSTSIRPEVIEADPEEIFKRVYVEFYRLLHAMEEDDEKLHKSMVENVAVDGDEFDWRSVLMRAEMAQGLWKQVAPQLQRHQPERAKSLQARVVRVCQRALERAAQQQKKKNFIPATPAKDIQKGSAIDRIFYSNIVVPDEADDEYVGGDMSREVSVGNIPTPSPTRRSVPPTVTPPPSEHVSAENLQASQRAQVEAAISGMAAQLKAETQRIHSRLRDQTTGLNKLEEVATENVEKVNEVTKDVKQHVAKSWRQTLGTWTLLFTLAGVFAFCLVTISMVPKRPGACLFFCNRQERQFCRTLPNGKTECLNLAASNQSSMDINNDVAHNEFQESTGATEDCIIGIDGECIYTPANDITIKDLQQLRPQEHVVVSGRKVDEENVPLPLSRVDMDSEANNNEKGQHEDEAFDAFAFTEPVQMVAAEPRKQNRVNLNIPIYKGRNFGPKEIRKVAAAGDVDMLAGYLAVRPDWINKQDKNGWTALHMAARLGSLITIQLLKDLGCDIQLETKRGESALDVLIARHGEDHPAAELLWDASNESDQQNDNAEEKGAVSIGESDIFDAAPGFDELTADLQRDGEMIHGDQQIAVGDVHTKVASEEAELHINEHPNPIEDQVESHSDSSFGHHDFTQDHVDAMHPEGEPRESSDHKEVFDDMHQEHPIATENNAEIHSYSLDEVHLFAGAFDGAENLRRALLTNPRLGDMQDVNRWNAFHIAARAGNTEVLRVLLEFGCNKDLRTNGDLTAYNLAVMMHGEHHPAAFVLQD